MGVLVTELTKAIGLQLTPSLGPLTLSLSLSRPTLRNEISYQKMSD